MGQQLLIPAGIMQYRQTRNMAKVAQREGEIQAQSEEVAAIQREADRKQRLAAAMASQVASSGAKGISAFEGSPLNILEQDIKAEEKATQRDIFQSELAALTSRTRGVISAGALKQQATIGALTTLGQATQSKSVPGGG